MIKVKCPNAACGKVLSVKDEYAGKRAKCPACGNALLIPASGPAAPPPAAPPAGKRPPRQQSGEAEYEVVEEPQPRKPARPEPPPAARKRKEPEEEYEEVEEPEAVEEEDLPPPKSRSGRTSAPRSGARRRDEEEEDEDLDREDDDEAPSSRSRRDRGPGSLRPRVGGAQVEMPLLITMGVGSFLLLFLAITTCFPWFSVSLGMMSITGAGTGVWDGIVILIFSILVALGAGAALASLFYMEPAISDKVVPIAINVAVGWAAAATFWQLGWVFKAFSSGGEQKVGNAMISMTIKLPSMSPGIGLWLGLVAALGAAGAFGYLAFRARKMKWLLISAGSGAGLGILMLILVLFARSSFGASAAPAMPSMPARPSMPGFPG